MSDEEATNSPSSSNATTVLSSSEDILRFWFGEEFCCKDAMNSLAYINSRLPIWFMRKEPSFEEVQLAHEQLVLHLRDGLLGDWDSSVSSLMAKVIVFDQFPRSIFRGTPNAFAFDELAVAAARKMVTQFGNEFNTELAAIQRLFVIVALQHSEQLENQDLGVSLAGVIAENDGEELIHFFKNIPGFPMEHYDVVKRFGRFPSRNDALGRESTEEELDWLASPDCPAWAKSQQKKA